MYDVRAMFLGHYALALAAKRATPRLSLGVLFGAAQFADILWPVLLAAGLEQVRLDPGNTAFTPLDFVSYPYSHSLVMLAVWGAPRLPLQPRQPPCVRDDRGAGRQPLAAGLRDAPSRHALLSRQRQGRPGIVAVDRGDNRGRSAAVSGWHVAVSEDDARRRRGGALGFALLASVLLLIYVGDALSPAAPPSVGALTAVALAGGVLFTAWAWWTDRHRAVQRTGA